MKKKLSCDYNCRNVKFLFVCNVVLILLYFLYFVIDKTLHFKAKAHYIVRLICDTV